MGVFVSRCNGDGCLGVDGFVKDNPDGIVPLAVVATVDDLYIACSLELDQLLADGLPGDLQVSGELLCAYPSDASSVGVGADQTQNPDGHMRQLLVFDSPDRHDRELALVRQRILLDDLGLLG